MKGEYFVWEKSPKHPKGAVVEVFTSMKKAKAYIKERAVQVDPTTGWSGTLEDGGEIGIIL